MTIKVRNKSKYGLKAYSTEASSGKDLCKNKYSDPRREAAVIPMNLSYDAFVIRE